jgi:hypothetical protein
MYQLGVIEKVLGIHVLVLPLVADHVGMAESDPIPFMMDPVYDSDEERESDRDVDEDTDVDEGEEHEDSGAARVGHADWCRCNDCIAMPTASESKCCSEDRRVQAKMRAIHSEAACITRTERFSTLCLDRDVLELTLMTIHDILSRGPLPDPVPNRYVKIDQFKVLIIVGLSISIMLHARKQD